LFQETDRLVFPQRSLHPLNEIAANFVDMSEENIYDEIEIEVRFPSLLMPQNALR